VMAERAKKGAAVYGELIRWCEKHQPFEPPKSPMAEGIRYVLHHEEALTRFLDAPDIPLGERRGRTAARPRRAHPQELSLRGLRCGR